MRDTIDIAESWFTGAEESPHLWRFITADGRFLAVVTQGASPVFRIHVFQRQSGAPQWVGTWWTEIDSPSLTDTLESAQRIAHERLQTLHESPAA